MLIKAVSNNGPNDDIIVTEQVWTRDQSPQKGPTFSASTPNLSTHEMRQQIFQLILSNVQIADIHKITTINYYCNNSECCVTKIPTKLVFTA